MFTDLRDWPRLRLRLGRTLYIAGGPAPVFKGQGQWTIWCNVLHFLGNQLGFKQRRGCCIQVQWTGWWFTETSPCTLGSTNTTIWKTHGLRSHYSCWIFMDFHGFSISALICWRNASCIKNGHIESSARQPLQDESTWHVSSPSRYGNHHIWRSRLVEPMFDFRNARAEFSYNRERPVQKRRAPRLVEA